MTVNHAVTPARPISKSLWKCTFRNCTAVCKTEAALKSHRKHCQERHRDSSLQTRMPSTTYKNDRCRCMTAGYACDLTCKPALVQAVASAFVQQMFEKSLPVGDNRSRGRVRVCGTALDGRKRNRGAAQRTHRSFWFKSRVIQEYDRLKETFPDDTAFTVAEIYGVSTQQVNSWLRDRVKIMERSRNKTHRNRNMARKLGRHGRFHECEAAIMKLFKARRDKGMRCGPRWLRSAMRAEVKRQFPSIHFMASGGFLNRFAYRWGISLRRRTNTKREPIEKRIPKIQRYMAMLRRRLKQDYGHPRYDSKWGLYLPENRACLDQVPAEGDNCKRTYTKKGTSRVFVAGMLRFESPPFFVWV